VKMDDRQRSGLTEIIPDGITFDCSMDQMTTYRVGGNAEVCCYPGEAAELSRLISYLVSESIPYVVMGKGSNLLVSDGGIKGAVIVLKDRLAAVETIEGDEPFILAGGGLTISGLLTYCSRNGLSGLEFLAGIPGTLGGAVFMNAGALGQEIGNLVREVLAIGSDGRPVVLNCNEIKFSYRSSSIPGGTVIYGVKLRMLKGDKESIAERIADNLKKRKEAQPLDYPSGGSVFKNPPDDYAGRLIEKAGLKGTRIGGAMISPKHGNFIVNTGGAKACDILALMNLARNRVKEQTGIDLEPEIVVLGEIEPRRYGD
jgi:UDP-N-acetylmuramate dehydrogenase